MDFHELEDEEGHSAKVWTSKRHTRLQRVLTVCRGDHSCLSFCDASQEILDTQYYSFQFSTVALNVVDKWWHSVFAR